MCIANHHFIQRITTQEKAKSTLTTDARPFQEAVVSYEASIREKDAEVSRLADELKATRSAAALEQRLMASAYHSLGLGVQRVFREKSGGGAGGSFLEVQRRALEFTRG